MAQAIPNSKPKMTKEDALKELSNYPSLIDFQVRVLGIRGYYKSTMGNPLKNDRGIYDDAMFIISPDMFASYNANTDPSINRAGIATLVAPQIVMYKVGTHGISGKNPREAFRQASFGIEVVRDGKDEIFKDSAQSPFWIDIHDGGQYTTSSEGCQTVCKPQWPSFKESLKDQLQRHNQKLFPYLLIEY